MLFRQIVCHSTLCSIVTYCLTNFVAAELVGTVARHQTMETCTEVLLDGSHVVVYLDVDRTEFPEDERVCFNTE